MLARLEASLIVLLLALARRVARFPTAVPSASKQSEDGHSRQLHALRYNASVTEHSLSADCAAADFFRIRRAPHVWHGALAARALFHGQVWARRAFRVLVTRVRESRMAACRRSRKKGKLSKEGRGKRNENAQSEGRMQGCLQSMTKLHGIGGKTTVDPQWQMSLQRNRQRGERAYTGGFEGGRKTYSSKSARKHGGQAPLWSRSSQLWIPPTRATALSSCATRGSSRKEKRDVQLSLRPQTLSQACNPSGSWSSCSSSASCSDMARFLPFLPAVNASWYASGQHTLPHWCLPHARWALHTLAQRYSSVSTRVCRSGSNRVVRYGSPHNRVVLSEVHRHVRGTGSRQDGHGPS